MIIFLYGPDSYRRGEKLKEVVGSYKKKYKNADIRVFDFGENPGDWVQAKDFFSQPSIFAESKVAVIKEGALVGEKEWVKTLKLQLENIKVFVIVSDNKKPIAKFSFLLKSPVKYQEFEDLEDVRLAAFIKKEIAARGLEFSASAWQSFLSYVTSCSNRSRIVINELDKIQLAGFRQPIEKAELDLIIFQKSTEEMFKAGLRFLYAKTLQQKLVCLEELLVRDESSDHVFNLLAFQTREKTAEKFAEYDVLRKSGKMDYEEALLDWALDVRP